MADWALRHGVTPAALAELRDMLTPAPPPPVGAPHTEAWAQSAVRLEAAGCGVWLGRNNVGQLPGPSGQPVRYGLANDSHALNAKLKSADLIGIRRVTITQAMVGLTIGQFVSREIKRPGWTWRGDAHEVAQQNWNTLVLSYGGDAAFATGPGTL